MNVLVIDNEEFLVENLCQYLKQIKDLSVKYVTCVKDALDLLSQTSFDLVVSDLWLHDTKSDDWLLEIGKIKSGQNIVIMSSYAIPAKISSSDQLNIIGYFEKPFDVKIFVNLINQLIKS